MAPVKSKKTYSRLTNPSDSNVSKALFRLNLRKYNTFKKKWSGELQIKDVKIPQKSQLNITVNDTFDKLLKGDIYQPIELKKTVCYYTSDSDPSKSALHTMTISHTHFPSVSRKIKKKNYTKTKKTAKDKNAVFQENVPKNRLLDQSVHTSLEVEKCNVSSLFRYNNMTFSNDDKTNEHHTESISFGAPKICSTPILQKQAEKYTTLIENDVKLSMIPSVRLDKNFRDYMQVVGVKAGSVNVTKNASEEHKGLAESNTEERELCSTTSPSFWFANKTEERDGAFGIKHSTPLKFEHRFSRIAPNILNDYKSILSVSKETEKLESVREEVSFPQISCNTPINSVNKKRRGYVRRIVFHKKTSVSSDTAETENDSCFEEKSRSFLQEEKLKDEKIYITLRNRRLIRRTIHSSKKVIRKCDKNEDDSLSDMFASDSLKSSVEMGPSEVINITDCSIESNCKENSNSPTKNISEFSMEFNCSKNSKNSTKKNSESSTKSNCNKNSNSPINNITKFSINSNNTENSNTFTTKNSESSTQYDCNSPIKSELSNSEIDLLENTNISNSPIRLNNHLENNCSPIQPETPIIILSSPTPTKNFKRESRYTEILNKIPECELKEDSIVLDNDCFIVPDLPVKTSIALKPGKSWRRSLSLCRKNSLYVTGVPTQHGSLKKQGVESNSVKCKLMRSLRRMTVRITAVNEDLDLLEPKANKDISRSYVSAVSNQEDHKAVCELSLNIRQSLVLTKSQPLNAPDFVLQRCGQTKPLAFLECYPDTCLQNCRKIGEGVYGEVFLKSNATGDSSVMKVIPIEGSLIINGDRQKKFEEIMSEIIIATALSDLRYNRSNQTTCFSEVQNVKCVQGRYPDRLLELWNLYNEVHQSENDSPEIFSDCQMFIVLELANGGNDLESFVFTNAQQCFSIFKQIAYALAIAENALSFEHRDLHWGNVLISCCDKKKIKFVLDNKEMEVATFGVAACIIDFTLSRITFDGVVVYNDLSQDQELFTAEGDYQFEVYRLMQQKNGNEWKHFEAYTNVLWLHYVLDKMLCGVQYSKPNTKVHKNFLRKLRELKKSVLKYDSVKTLINNFIF